MKSSPDTGEIDVSADGQLPIPISVIIPVRNGSRDLPLCLNALLQNQLDNVEIIVIDDDSTDDTSEVVDSVKRSVQTPFQYIRLPVQSGPASARNEGMRRAGSQYVFFLDADIVIPQRTIEWMRETISGFHRESKTIGVMGVYSDHIPLRDFYTNFKNIYICFLYDTTPTTGPYIHTPILCLKRSILEQFGGFDSRLRTAEDFHLGLKLAESGYCIRIDRRIKGVHLKQLSLRNMFKEDCRRIRDLLGIQLTKKQSHTFQAHRWHRVISVALPPLIMILSVAGYFFSLLWWMAAALVIAFYLCNIAFIAYAVKKKGLFFGIKAALFLYVEMLWAGLCLGYWMIRFSCKPNASSKKEMG